MDSQRIQRYLQRIGLEQPPEVSIDYLRALQRNHLLHVPFENLDIHEHIPIVLDVNAFFIKVVGKGRGGFCYELNGLFNELLCALGFRSILVSARVFDTQDLCSPEFDHACILVYLGTDTWLVDVGFGEFSLSPILVMPNHISMDSHGTYKMEEWDKDHFLVSRKVDAAWKREYLFSQVPRSLSDFSERCLYHQTSPDSHFTRKRVCSLATKNGRITLTDSALKIREGNETRLEEFSGMELFNEKLFRYFGIRI